METKHICKKCGKKTAETVDVDNEKWCIDCAYEDFQKQYQAGEVIGTKKHKEKEINQIMYR